MVDDTEKLLSRTQAAALIGISVRTLERLEAAGRGPPFRRVSPRVIHYPEASLRIWLRGEAVMNRIEELSQAISDTDSRVDTIELRLAAVERSLKASALLSARKKEASDVPGYGR